MSVKIRKKGTQKWTFVAGLGRPGPAGSGGDAAAYEAGEGVVFTETAAGTAIGVALPTIPLTQAEYDALSDEEKQKRALYIVTDGAAGGSSSGGASGAPSGGTAGVASFKGRAGAVVPLAGDYTAEMVGARPDTWTPTAAEVGARPAAWMPTAAEVGARPNTWMPTAADIGAATQADVTAAIQAAILDSWEASY